MAQPLRTHRTEKAVLSAQSLSAVWQGPLAEVKGYHNIAAAPGRTSNSDGLHRAHCSPGILYNSWHMDAANTCLLDE